MIYTPENELSLVKYLTKDLKDAIYKSLVQLRFQMNEYIESGSIAPSHSNKEDTRNEHIVEDKLKRTAKRILDYIDHIDEEASQAGMKQDEARKKAHEIIESITEEIKVEPIQMPQAININLDSTEVDQIAFELQEITKLALLEKTRLSEQLNLIQSRVSTLPTDNEDQGSHLLINALKAEVDHLRATAEENIRAKTKSSLQIIEKMHAIPSIKHRMREDMQSAQRAALKDLRQVYVKLYQTNKLLDELAH
ncbi:hypothetical protein [Parasitella parasitica]|uniref:Uncharacterized protein n=1 Tax=Parasitella parasitica TaxID=35722 RepID=A0A0B7NGZ7_9FUNG|nr:hypothetical protein [Parasitella parasitica]